MPFNSEELHDIKHALKYFMRRNISIRSPRYKEFEVILEKVEQLNANIPRHRPARAGTEAVPDWLDRRYHDESDIDSQVGG